MYGSAAGLARCIIPSASTAGMHRDQTTKPFLSLDDDLGMLAQLQAVDVHQDPQPAAWSFDG